MWLRNCKVAKKLKNNQYGTKTSLPETENPIESTCNQLHYFTSIFDKIKKISHNLVDVDRMKIFSAATKLICFFAKWKKGGRNVFP